MQLYKLTDANGYTRRGKTGATRWVPGKTVTLPEDGRGDELCEAGILHAYTNPRLAVMMDPYHGRYLPDGRMLVCEGEVAVRAPDKVGCHEIRAIEWTDTPTVTIEQRIRFGILAALSVDRGDSPQWTKWARGWLDGTDRSRNAAGAAAGAVALDARTAHAAHATRTAAWGARTAHAAHAAHAAAWAAVRAARADPTIDLVMFARKALTKAP